MKKIFLIVAISGLAFCCRDSKKTISTPDQTATPVANPIPPTPVQIAPGMNPPHGQQGHDCAIAVGSPLNSSPVINPSSSSPILNPSNSTPVQTAPGMNPPHGQQGHDCAIAVGSPLN